MASGSTIRPSSINAENLNLDYLNFYPLRTSAGPDKFV